MLFVSGRGFFTKATGIFQRVQSEACGRNREGENGNSDKQGRVSDKRSHQ